MPDVPKILSLIVPMYNMEGYIRRCLSSVCNVPGNRALEVVVINDGSTDGSLGIAREYEAAFPGVVRVVDKPNGNYGSCINVGLKSVTGQYVKVLDADDTLLTETLADFLVFLQTADADAVISDFVKVTPDGKKLRTVAYDFPQAAATLDDVTAQKDLWTHAVTYSTAIFRGMDYHQTEGISYTDQEWLFLPMSRVRTVRHFPHPLYRYTCGRQAQTIDPEVFVRNISQEIAGLKVMFGEYAAGQPLDSMEDRYMVSRLMTRTGAVYSMYQLLYPSQLDMGELRELDTFIKDRHPALYALSDGIDAPMKFVHFKYIAAWRRNAFRRNALHKVFTGYKKLRRLVLG